MSLRFLNVVLASHLFVSVTSSEDFAYALMQAGLPYRYGFALLAAMRFVPYFKTQANTVLQAQMARGGWKWIAPPRRKGYSSWPSTPSFQSL